MVVFDARNLGGAQFSLPAARLPLEGRKPVADPTWMSA
jgi:hypothetical protein